MCGWAEADSLVLDGGMDAPTDLLDWLECFRHTAGLHTPAGLPAVRASPGPAFSTWEMNREQCCWLQVQFKLNVKTEQVIKRLQSSTCCLFLLNALNSQALWTTHSATRYSV